MLLFVPLSADLMDHTVAFKTIIVFVVVSDAECLNVGYHTQFCVGYVRIVSIYKCVWY